MGLPVDNRVPTAPPAGRRPDRPYLIHGDEPVDEETPVRVDNRIANFPRLGLFLLRIEARGCLRSDPGGWDLLDSAHRSGLVVPIRTGITRARDSGRITAM